MLKLGLDTELLENYPAIRLSIEFGNLQAVRIRGCHANCGMDSSNCHDAEPLEDDVAEQSKVGMRRLSWSRDHVQLASSPTG